MFSSVTKGPASVRHQGQAQVLYTLEGFQLGPVASSVPLISFILQLSSLLPCRHPAPASDVETETVYLAPQLHVADSLERISIGSASLVKP